MNCWCVRLAGPFPKGFGILCLFGLVCWRGGFFFFFPFLTGGC